MHKLSGALSAFLILTGCTVTPVQRHDYSKMQQDAFTPVVKQVRGNTRYLSSNLSLGHEQSMPLMEGKRREELDGFFQENGGLCATANSEAVMRCSVSRWWAYADVRISPDREKICKPGMQLVYDIYFDEPLKSPAIVSKFSLNAVHLAQCPDEATRHLLSDPYRATGVPEF